MLTKQRYTPPQAARKEENGLRTSKTVNSITTHYVWAGGTLIGQYDDVNVMMFNGVGFNLNGEQYFYVKNLQGDVISVVDDNGNEVASYEYDAWGTLGLPNAVEKNNFGNTPKSNLPYNNHIVVRRDKGTNGFIQIKQQIFEDDYEASLDITYAVGSSQQKFDKYINEDVYFMFARQDKKVLDERFSLLAVNQFENAGFVIVAQKDLKAISINYGRSSFSAHSNIIFI